MCSMVSLSLRLTESQVNKIGSSFNILDSTALPDVATVLTVQHHGESAWAQAIRIVTRHKDDTEESYFMKVINYMIISLIGD